MQVVQGVHHIVGDFFQRFDLHGCIHVSLLEREAGEVEDAVDQFFQHVDLADGVVGEVQALAVQVLRHFRDVHRVVAQAFEFGHDLVVFIQDVYLILFFDVWRHVHEIVADLVGQHVDVVFLLHDLVHDSFVVNVQQVHRLFDIRTRSGVRGHQRVVAAAQRQGWRLEKYRAERLDHFVVLAVLVRLVLDDAAGQFFVDRQHGEQQQRAAQIEDRIRVCDEAGIDGAGPQRVQQPELVRDRDREQHQDGLAQVEQDVDYADAFGLGLRANGADDGGRDAVAEVDAHDDRVDGVPDKKPRHGERLQDTDGRGRTLQQERDARAGQITEDGIAAQSGEHPLEQSAVRQARDGTGHVHQAGEQDAETDGDGADAAGIFEFEAHDQQHADDEGQRRQRGRFEELQPGRGGVVHVQQTDDLSRDGRADVRADDDAQRLAQRNDTRADEARGDDDGRGGRLNDRGDGNAQQECLEGIVRYVLHGDFQGAGGAFLQTVAHHAHAVQEHGQAAQQGDNVEYTHFRR